MTACTFSAINSNKLRDMTLRIPVYCDVTPCGWVHDSRPSKESSIFIFKVKSLLQPKTLCSFEKSLTCKMAQRHILEEQNPHLHCGKTHHPEIRDCWRLWEHFYIPLISKEADVKQDLIASSTHKPKLDAMFDTQKRRRETFDSCLQRSKPTACKLLPTTKYSIARNQLTTSQ
jgi:hypothetical protein